jgi:hypothetical protein
MTPPSTSYARATPSTPASGHPTELHRHQWDGVPAGAYCQIRLLQTLLPAAAGLPLLGPSPLTACWVKQWCLLVPHPLSPSLSLSLSLFLSRIDVAFASTSTDNRPKSIVSLLFFRIPLDLFKLVRGNDTYQITRPHSLIHFWLLPVATIAHAGSWIILQSIDYEGILGANL